VEWCSGPTGLSTLTNRGIGVLKLLVRDMDLDTRLGGEFRDMYRLQKYGHSSSVLRPHQPIGLGKEVGSSHHIIQMQGLEGKIWTGKHISPHPGTSGFFPATHFPPNPRIP